MQNSSRIPVSASSANYSTPSDTRHSVPASIPLTIQQRWLWDLTCQFPDWNCVVPYAFELKGELNVALLQRSLNEIIRRHCSLRTRISMVEETPKLDICDFRIHLDIVKVIGQSRTEIEESARRLFVKFGNRRMDPAVGPLLEDSLLKLSDHEHWLLIAIHRLVADCLSADQLFQELWGLYDESASNRTVSPVADPPQYSDYAFWQQTQGAQWLLRHEDYWNRRLAGATSVRWPDDSEAAKTHQSTIRMMSRRFGKELSDSVQELARRTRSLSAMVMLTVYVAVLWRWSGQRDLILPFNIAGRQAEHKLIVGFFAYILYLRIELKGDETFSELQRLVSNEFFRALAHQDFGKQAAKRPELLAGTFCQWVTWHPGTAPAQTDSASSTQLAVGRLPLSEFGQGLSTLPPTIVDVDLTFFDTDQGIYAQGVYRADRFAPTTMERLLSNLHCATEFFVRNPASAVATTPQI
jgi:hypothetical protein